MSSLLHQLDRLHRLTSFCLTFQGFDDVLQIESALERMLTDDNYTTSDLDMAFNCLQDEFGGDSSSGASDRFFATHYMPHATIRSIAG